MRLLARFFAVYATAILVGCPYQAAHAQSPLPAAKHGQPAFSFEGGKRVSAQKNQTAGMREYGSGPSSPGTGVVEVSGDGLPARIGTRATILSPGDPSAPANAGSVARDTSFITTIKSPTRTARGRAKPATTVVKILGPDGKFEYTEVPFMGEVAANKRASNVTELKEGAGKVKEYSWARH